MRSIFLRLIAGFLFLISISLLPVFAQGQKTDTVQNPAMSAGELKQKRLQWFRDARFGMMIHWGIYSVPAGEWKGKLIPGLGEWIMNRAKIPVVEYEQLAKQFNPVKFNAEEIVGLAKAAGMKYIVITSK